nr:MAG TPA: hypothetical protein [Caudoviricetes sp.]
MKKYQKCQSLSLRFGVLKLPAILIIKIII